jgi:pyroglutamyl-peptidase
VSETILITGFEPFGGIAGNPTMDIVAALHGARIDNRQVVGRILPVTYDGHLLRLKMLMDEVEPALVIGFGLDINALGIQVETQAVNRADFTIPDNAGALLKNVTLEAGGPAYRMSTFPVDEIVAALSAVRIKAAPSGDAGRYLCNATLFHLLDLCASKPQRPLCGFVHVPYATEQLAVGQLFTEQLATAMPLEMMIEAARIVLRQSSLVIRQMALPTQPQPAQPLHQQSWMEPAAAVG